MMMLKICRSFLCCTQQLCSQPFVDQQQYPSSVVLQLSCSSRKKSIPTPWKVNGNSLAEGGLKSQNFRSKV